MKYIQIGILAALILVAGLLALNLIQERQVTPPAGAEQAAAAEPAEVPAEVSPAETEAAPVQAETPAPAVAAVPGKAVSPKPAPVETASRKPAPGPTPATRPSPASKPAAAEATVPAAPRPASTVEPIQVDPPPSTPDSWGTPAESASAQPERNRYELMRPERKDPAPSPAAAATPSVPEPPRTVTLPAGTILTVRTSQMMSSESASVDDAFTGNLDQPLVHEDLIIAERGSKVTGRVVQVVDSGRVKGTALLAIQLTAISTSDGQTVPVQTQSFTMNAEKSTKGDVAKVGIATGIGAALGAIFGGGKGAAIGAGVGAGAGTGTVLAGKGKPAEIPSETRINFRLEAPLTITEKINQ